MAQTRMVIDFVCETLVVRGQKKDFFKRRSKSPSESRTGTASADRAVSTFLGTWHY